LWSIEKEFDSKRRIKISLEGECPIKEDSSMCFYPSIMALIDELAPLGDENDQKQPKSAIKRGSFAINAPK
jgi:hypothetical protein